ncbi:hypothetical protein M9Y10_034575 [Tritrichomonas musculus]|uniref:Uncharacterized protein n=1 Tax=Tritrichomonas musculus TaxID=1915356 RepID=A0ABR2KGE3_9EUKA
MEIPYDTVKSFYKSYLKHGSILPKQGRPIKIDNDIKERVVQTMEQNPTSTLRCVANNFQICATSVKNILNEHKIHFFCKYQYAR